MAQISPPARNMSLTPSGSGAYTVAFLISSMFSLSLLVLFRPLWNFSLPNTSSIVCANISEKRILLKSLPNQLFTVQFSENSIHYWTDTKVDMAYFSLTWLKWAVLRLALAFESSDKAPAAVRQPVLTVCQKISRSVSFYTYSMLIKKVIVMLLMKSANILPTMGTRM